VRYRWFGAVPGPCLAALLLAGCATSVGSSCVSSSLDCLMQNAWQPHFQACVDDLFWYPQRDRLERRAIDTRYRYPATSADTFFDLQRMGIAGLPSPSQWCEDYAARKVAVRMCCIPRYFTSGFSDYVERSRRGFPGLSALVEERGQSRTSIWGELSGVTTAAAGGGR